MAPWKVPKCVVKNCPGKDSNVIRLFRIPMNCREKWCEKLKIGPNKLNTKSRVCSRHFSKDCIGNKLLRKGAMPNKNLDIGNDSFGFSGVCRRTQHINEDPKKQECVSTSEEQFQYTTEDQTVLYENNELATEESVSEGELKEPMNEDLFPENISQYSLEEDTKSEISLESNECLFTSFLVRAFRYTHIYIACDVTTCAEKVGNLLK